MKLILHSVLLAVAFGIMFTAAAATTTPAAWADHGSGGGGGCSGDCSPPTLGQDNSGRQYVSEGFGINDNFFSVESFSQDLSSQVVHVGEPVEITLRIYENEGPGNLYFVKLMLGSKFQVSGGSRQDIQDVSIEWRRTSYNAEPAITYDLNNNYIKDLQVTSKLADNSFGAPNSLTEITYSFVPQRPLNSEAVAVELWDSRRNAWTNYFNNALKIVKDPEFSLDNRLDNTKLYDPQDEVLTIPSWLKQTAKLWSQDKIDSAAFSMLLEYCIENDIVNVPKLPKYQPADTFEFVDTSRGFDYYIDRYYNEPVYQEWFDKTFPGSTIEQAVGITSSLMEAPDWTKADAAKWADNQITDNDFANTLKYLASSGFLIPA